MFTSACGVSEAGNGLIEFLTLDETRNKSDGYLKKDDSKETTF